MVVEAGGRACEPKAAREGLKITVEGPKKA